MSTRVLILVVLSFSVGIILSTLHISQQALLTSFIVCFILVLISFYFRIPYRIFILIVLISLFLGCNYFLLRKQAPTSYFLELEGKRVSIEGEITSHPVLKSSGYQFEFSTKEGKLLVRGKSDEPLKVGDTILVSGNMESPKNFLTDTGKTFDYIHFLEKEHIFFIVQNSHINFLSRPEVSIKRFLYGIVDTANESLETSILSLPRSILSGILFGDDNTIPKEIKNDFVRTGTIHILALSGYNISILVTWVLYASRRLFKYRISTFLGIFSIILFVVATGASSTSIRAGLMAGLALIAQYYGRPHTALRILFLASFIMILWNPYIVLYDVSFHLSFLATLGILLFDPSFQKIFSIIKFSPIRSVVSVTCAAQVLVLPYIIYVFGQLSLISPVINILIAPIVPLIMFLGMITTILASLFEPLAYIVGLITEFVINLFLKIISFFSTLKFATISTTTVPLMVILLFYVLLFIYFFSKNNKKS